MPADVVVRSATADDVEPVCRLLAKGFSGTSVAFYRGMLNYPWLSAGEKPDYGEVLVAGGDPVGFFGAMYSNREVNGRTERFCNVFSWYVLPEYRRHSMALVTSLMRRPGLTLTNVTAAQHVVPIFRKLGFTLTDEFRLICRPRAASLLSRRGAQVRVVPHDEVSAQLLGPAAFRIFEDHLGRTVRRTVFEAAGDGCLLVSKRMFWSGFRFARTDLYYASDRDFLRRHFAQILSRMLWMDKSVALHADPHVLGFTPEGVERIAATALYPSSTLFRSDRVEAADVDRLYSELVILP